MDWGGPLGLSNVGQFTVGQVVSEPGVPRGIELTQGLMLTAGITYTVDFDWAAHRETSSNANTQGGIFDLIVEGVSLANGAAGLTSNTTQNFGHLSASFTPTFTGVHQVGARIQRPFTVPTVLLWQSVDNFTLSSVPEPSSFMILGLAFGGAAGLRFRRRQP